MAHKYIITYTSSWGQVFTFGTPYVIGRDGMPRADMVHTVPASGGVGADGEIQANATFEGLRFSLSGVIRECNSDAMQTYTDTLASALADRRSGIVRVRRWREPTLLLPGAFVSDRQVSCRVAGRILPAPGFEPVQRWSIAFRAESYAWRSFTSNATVALALGANIITIGGTEESAPVIAINVSTVGTVTLTGALGTLSLNCDTVGTWFIYLEDRVILRPSSTGNFLGQITAGGFFNLPSRATNLTISVAGGLTFSSANLIATPRWATAG
jgi:hypothetical protein